MQKTKLDRILYGIIAGILSLIILVTVISFATKKALPGKNLRDADPKPEEIQSINKRDNSNLAAYTGLGSIRVITAPDPENGDENGTIALITPWLSYPQGDSVFFEELSRKRLVITGIFTSYFTEKTKKQLLSSTEDKIKADLILEINNQLSLGQISNIFFTDYIYFE